MPIPTPQQAIESFTAAVSSSPAGRAALAVAEAIGKAADKAAGSHNFGSTSLVTPPSQIGKSER